MSDYNVQAIRESLHIGDGTGCGCVEVSSCCMEIQDALDEIERLQAKVYESEIALKSISRGTADYWAVVRIAANALAKLKALEGGNDSE